MLTGRKIDKQDVVYTHNGTSFSLQKKEIPTHATRQMNTQDIMLSEIKSQAQKDKYCMTPLL